MYYLNQKISRKNRENLKVSMRMLVYVYVYTYMGICMCVYVYILTSRRGGACSCLLPPPEREYGGTPVLERFLAGLKITYFFIVCL